MVSATPETPPAPAPRRTQAERRASTRALLLDATLECLIEHGYRDTTTAQIESRAGVSRGARLHHFPKKSELLSSSVGHLYERISRRYAEAMAEVDEGPDRFRTGYRLLWETYADPAYAAVLELFMAARTDAELRGALRGTAADYQREVRHRANAYFPELAIADADGLLESLQAVMTGLALRRAVYGEGRTEGRVLDLVARMVETTFAAASASTASAAARRTK